jgi:hypothetical protein
MTEFFYCRTTKNALLIIVISITQPRKIMCMDVRKTCECGSRIVQFHLRDNIMSKEVILSLYCPECCTDAKVDDETMLEDNSWIIEYDVELARFLAAAKLQVPPDMVSPSFLFDSGYATWQEMYPGEQKDILEEREEIMGLLKADPQEYLTRINSWNIARVKRLKANGWRKAQAA